MRDRESVLTSLEQVYREAFARAEEDGDAQAMSRLDFEFQRDQVWLEVALDVRSLLAEPGADPESRKSLIDQAKALRDLTRGR